MFRCFPQLMRCLLLSLIVLSIGSLATAQETANAEVINMWENLNVRAEPNADAAVIAELAGRTPVTVIARTRNNVWLQVRLGDGQGGWAAANYIALDVELWEIPVFGEPTSTQPAPQSQPDNQETQPPPPADTTSGARVSSAAYGGLNLRDNINGARIGLLPADTPLTILGAQGGWLNIQTSDGQTGWVSAAYVDMGDATVPTQSTEPSENSQPTVTTGNGSTHFSRVGDSISASDFFLYPIGHGAYDLGAYGHLQGAIDFFSQGSNSFLHRSLAASPGWTTADVLNSARANPQSCNPGETPLACEYRITQPAVALIMFGSNDVAWLSLQQYAANLEQIIQITLANSTIPVLTTIPPRNGYDVSGINNIVRSLANRYNAPLWDYYSEMVALPDNGLSADGLHPSAPDFGYAATFTEGYLKYGYVQRNLGALTMLYTLWRDVLAG